MPTDRITIAALCAALAALPDAAAVPGQAAGRGAAAGDGAVLYITTEAAAPSSMLDARGQVVGIATDKVRAAMQRAGVAYTIALLPWKRAYAAARERKDACVYSTTRTPERETLFKWVGPTDSARWVLMARADRHIALRNLEDARSYLIGTYNGDARDHYLRSRGFRVDTAPHDLINPPKLLLGRIDLWAAALRRGSLVLRQNGWEGKIVPVLEFNQREVFLACNRGVPDAIVERLNDAFAALEREGALQRIERAYDDWAETKVR